MAGLSLLDLGFYISETEESPKHVSGLMIFKKPAGKANFFDQLLAQCLASSEVSPPFNQVIKLGSLTGPKLQTSPDFNIANHIISHNLLAATGENDQRALHEFCAQLHDVQLDREKPLWEFHFIDGLAGDRFAIFNKIHHVYADGMTLTRWLSKCLNDSPDQPFFNVLWNIERSGGEREASGISIGKIVNSLVQSGKTQIKMWRGINKLALQIAAERAGLTKNAVAVPFKSQRTPLTGQAQKGRQIAVAKVSMARIDALRKRTRSSLNHIALTCIDGALHRFLEEYDADLDEPITINMPVNLRKEGETKAGNRIGIVLVDLAKRTNDPYERLREIGFTLRNVRHQVDGVDPEAMVAYTLALNSVTMLIEAIKLSNVLPPLGNTLVSNVPGPKNTKYLDGAELEEMYPVSTLPAGHHLNITLYSYNGHLYFGLVASEAIPDIQDLSVFIDQAFEELEQAV